MSLLNLIKGASNKTYDAIFRDNLEEVADLFVCIPDREAKENFQRAFERHIKRNYSFSNDQEVKKRMIRNYYEKIREDKFSIAALFCAVPQEEVLKADRDAFDSMGFLEFLQKIIENQMTVSEEYLFERFRKAIKPEEREVLPSLLLPFFEGQDKIKDPLVREHVWSLHYQTLFNEINIQEIGWGKPRNTPSKSLEKLLEKADSKTLCALALERSLSSYLFYEHSDFVVKGFSEELKSKFYDYKKDPPHMKEMLTSIWRVDNSSALEALLGDRGPNRKYLVFLCSLPGMEKKVPCLSENSGRDILRKALKTPGK